MFPLRQLARVILIRLIVPSHAYETIISLHIEENGTDTLEIIQIDELITLILRTIFCCYKLKFYYARQIYRF